MHPVVMGLSMRHLLITICLAGVCACAPAAQPPAQTLWSEAALADLRVVAANAPAEGLPDQQAALDELARFERSPDPAARFQLGIAADSLFDSLAHSFAEGALSPTSVDPSWKLDPPPAPDLYALHEAVEGGARPSVVLSALLPQGTEYAALRAELARVRAGAAESTDSHARSRDARISALRVNMERWRWLPRSWEERRVEVRVAQARTTLYLFNESTSQHLSIVGAQRSPTPTFRAEINSITLNPSWTPPQEIVRNELLPRFRRDPAAAVAQGFDAVAGNGAVVDPASVDWLARPFPYTLRQRPGANNALGRVRFDLPNSFAVYLHDTPNRALFAREQRTFSHGCIRIDDPIGLAEAVLADPQWTKATIQAAIDTEAQRRIAVSRAMPIYILYLTAWLSEDGSIGYSDDVYERDAPVLAALDAPDAALVNAIHPIVGCAP